MKGLAAILGLCALLLPVTAEANGSSKKRIVLERDIQIQAPPREPLLALGLLGHGLIISDDFDVDLFDIEERRRQHYHGRDRHRGRR